MMNLLLKCSLRIAIMGLLTCMIATPMQTQSADCGFVEAIDYPIDISDTLRESYDDFGLFRSRFGGLHTGLDIGFNRRGEPVRAAARGRVTYADVNGWDTEKGVVIVEHTLPDGTIAYSLYGHMEQTDTILFPRVGDCVEQGEVLGTIGWPSRGLPHLHYEIRSFLPNDGGPGYVTQNPLLEGWHHPFDFTMLWQARLSLGATGYATFSDYPTVPPVLLDSGLLMIASGDRLTAYAPPMTRLWSIQMESVITGTAALPGGRLAVQSREGQGVMMQDGRFIANWQIDGPDLAFAVLGETLIFPTNGGGMAALNAAGQPLWSLDGISNERGRVVDFQSSGTQAAVLVRAGGTSTWRVVDANGMLIHEARFERTPVFAPASHGWLLIDGMDLKRYASADGTNLASLGALAGRSARLTTDVVGNSYIFVGDRESTLIGLGPSGEMRWRTRYPTGGQAQPPLLDVGGGCLLYSLDSRGTLSIFNAADGNLMHQVQLYTGGATNGHPRARLLHVDEHDRVLVGSGFLSVLALDGRIIGGNIVENCLLG
jgi:hypothetical protein